MDCREQAKKVYEVCVIRANSIKSTMAYGEVLDALGYNKGVSGQAIRYGLELVLIACAMSGLPILTSIVVNKSSGSPSAGQYPEKSWKNEAQKVFNHDHWPDVDEINWEYAWMNRKKLSDKYGTPGYWDNVTTTRDRNEEGVPLKIT